MKSLFYISFTISLVCSLAFDANLTLNTKDNIIELIQNTSKIEKNILIDLKKGTYKLNGNNNSYIFNLRDLDHFVLDGHGSTLLINNPSSGLFRFINSKNIIIKNITIDYTVLPHIAGTIKSINKQKNSLVFSPDLNYKNNLPINLAIDKKTKARIYTYFYAQPGITKEETTKIAFVKNIKHISGNNYRVDFTKKCKFSKKDHMALLFRYNTQSLFRMISCKQISYSNINMFASPGGVFVAKDTSSVYIKNCNLSLKKGRWVSSNADMFHFQSSRNGPIIQGCTVEGVGDDVLNFYTIPMYPIRKISSNTLLMRKKNFIAKRGDIIDFFNPEDGEILVSKIVKKVQSSGKHNILEFTQNLPKGIKINQLHLYDKNCTSSGFKIENSIFRKSKRFGCYLKATNGVIANNHFSCFGNSAIFIQNEPKWPEGLASENIIIKRNYFNRCDTKMHKKKAFISIGFLTKNSHKKSKFNTQKNISIIENVFSGKPYYNINNTKNLILYKNIKK